MAKWDVMWVLSYLTFVSCNTAMFWQFMICSSFPVVGLGVRFYSCWGLYIGQAIYSYILFQNEAMTGTHTQNPVYSRITLALMEDTGWYKANYSVAEGLTWGNQLGCDFAEKSCAEWIAKRKIRYNFNDSLRFYLFYNNSVLIFYPEIVCLPVHFTTLLVIYCKIKNGVFVD